MYDKIHYKKKKKKNKNSMRAKKKKKKKKKKFGFEPWVGKIPLEKGMATHSSIPALRIPWTEKPDELQSTG